MESTQSVAVSTACTTTCSTPVPGPRVLTFSAIEAFGRCEREYEIAYEQLISPVDYPSALAIGSGFHAGAELLHRGRPMYEALKAAEEQVERFELRARPHLDSEGLAALAESVPRDRARVRAMLTAWHDRWLVANNGAAARIDRDLDVIETELVVEAPLVNPVTKRASRTFLLSGRIDAVVRHRDDRHRFSSPDGTEGFWIYELKSTAEDLDTFSEAMRFSSQPQLYAALAENHFGGELGPVLGSIIDIARKPAIRSKKSESAVDFETRALAEYRAEPDRFLRRIVLPVDVDAKRDALLAAWRVAQGIRTAERYGYLKKSGPACRGPYGSCRFVRLCRYDDRTGYTRKETAHEELAATTAS
jgi:hypothetical protein